MFSSTSSTIAIQNYIATKGNISFQEQPCPSSDKAVDIKLEGIKATKIDERDEINLVTLSLKSGKDYFIGVPSEWQTKTQTTANSESATLRATSDDDSKTMQAVHCVQTQPTRSITLFRIFVF